MTKTLSVGLLLAAVGCALALLAAPIAADLDIGVEWVNNYPDNPSCANLSNRDDCAMGMYNYFTSHGWTGRFHWGNNASWETDYKEQGFGNGADNDWIDTVDIAMHADHGNPWGVGFNASHDDQFLHCNECRWGDDYDLEWIVLDACSVLRDEYKWANWCDAFRKLHIICSFDTNAHDSGSRGEKFAQKLFNGWTVVQAWFYAAEHTEGSGTYAACMGAAASGKDTYYDHIHGKGSVASDPWPLDWWWWQNHNCD